MNSVLKVIISRNRTQTHRYIIIYIFLLKQPVCAVRYGTVSLHLAPTDATSDVYNSIIELVIYASSEKSLNAALRFSVQYIEE